MATATLTPLTGLGNLNLSGLGGLGGLVKTISPPSRLTAPSPGKSQPPLTSITSRQETYADIETIPDESRRHLFGLDDVAGKPIVDPVIGNWPDFMRKTVKDLEAIIESCNPSETWLKAFATWERNSEKPRSTVLKLTKDLLDHETDKIKTMSITPEYLQIVAIGIAHGDGEIQGFISDNHIGGTVTEADLLEWFWASIAQSTSLVGFNFMSFDLNAIKARSAMLGIKPSRDYTDIKPWGVEINDLMLRRWPKGPPKGFGLKNTAKLYGIEPPAGDMDGSQTFKTWQEDPLKVREYVMSDVFVTRELKKKWTGLFC